MNQPRTQPVDNPLLDARSSKSRTTDLNWLDQAACRNFPPDMFYPARGIGHRKRVDGALAVCAMCPVTAACNTDTDHMPITLRQVGMVRGGRYYRSAKTGRIQPEGAR